MFSNLKDSAIWTARLFITFGRYFWFTLIALSDWMKGFAFVDKWFFMFFLAKAGIVLLGLVMTPMPLWLLIGISFLPLPMILPIFFIMFIVMFRQF